MYKKELSERQRKILAFIANHTARYQRPPTIREIGAAVEISSTSVVTYNLKRLVDRELIKREADVSRGLSLTDEALRLIGMARPTERPERILRVPLAGNIVAGEPLELVGSEFSTYDEEDAVELSAAMLGDRRRDDLFALRVSGQSMIDAMVNDGDIVIMRRQATANNGDMVAVWITPNDTTTLKHYYYENGRVRLQPANPTMEPIYVDPDRVRVQGKVEMVIRQL